MDSDDEEIYPYMELTRVYENNRVIWKKEAKDMLTDEKMCYFQLLTLKEIKLRPTGDKLIWLYNLFANVKRDAGRYLGKKSSKPLIINIERMDFMQSTFNQFNGKHDLDLRRRIKIKFLAEESRDAGGLLRDWLSLLVGELFSFKFGLFKKTNTPEVSYTINPYSEKMRPNHLEYYYFCGQIMAKALYERIPIKAYLAKFMLKRLTNEKLTWEDLKYYDTSLFESIKCIKSEKLNMDMGAFVTTQKNPISHECEQIELKEDGTNIEVTEENKEEFVDLLCNYLFVKSISSQINELAFGFFSLIPGIQIITLDFEELDFFLCGEPEISIEDWRANTRYKGEYKSNHKVIKWFWDFLGTLNSGELEKFLQFCTGSARAPAEGFCGLSSNGELCLFTIEPVDYDPKLKPFPLAHTCFNKLELPMYPSREILDNSLRTIINNSLCFQFSAE